MKACLRFAAMVLILAPPTAWARERAPLSWAGPYAGVNAGYAWADADLKWSNTSGVDDPAAIAERQNLSTRSLSSQNLTGGGQLGFNWQTGAIIFGIEADANKLESTSTSSVALSSNFPDNSIAQSVTVHSLFTARGRIGVTFNDAFFYFTGGWAGGSVTFADSSLYPISFQSVSVRPFLSGFVVGGGLEQAISRYWSIKGEYLYTDLGSASSSSCYVPNPTLCYTHSHDVTLQIVRAGLNFKF